MKHYIQSYVSFVNREEKLGVIYKYFGIKIYLRAVQEILWRTKSLHMK
jgi:hypothetical protein